MSEYAIELADGRRLDGLRMNGSMFVTQEKITKADFTEEALKRVVITEIPEDGETSETVIEGARFDGVLEWDEGQLFCIREKTADEKREDELRALREKNRFVEDCLMEISEEVYK